MTKSEKRPVHKLTMVIIRLLWQPPLRTKAVRIGKHFRVAVQHPRVDANFCALSEMEPAQICTLGGNEAGEHHTD